MQRTLKLSLFVAQTEHSSGANVYLIPCDFLTEFAVRFLGSLDATKSTNIDSLLRGMAVCVRT